MNSLTLHTNLLRRFPAFELSYETVSHKKVSVQHSSIAVAISSGRKYFMWFTHREHTCEDACYFVGLDKDRRICSVEERSVHCTDSKYYLGTVVYGTLTESNDVRGSDTLPVFLAEDIYQFQGNNLANLCFGDRVGFLRDFAMQHHSSTYRDTQMRIALPIMWFVDVASPEIPPDLAKRAAYSIHHIQYRAIDRVAPYINVTIPKRGVLSTPTPTTSSDIAQKISATSILKPVPRFDYSKPAYRYSAVFNVTADPQLDLYHLYAYGGSAGGAVYCGLAGIQSFKTSIFMNGVFRRIRENSNLDLAEESDDDADFENTDLNKYVDLDAVVPLECVFNQKHKKWVPVRLAATGDKVIHIEKLVLQAFRNYADNDRRDSRSFDARYGTNLR